MATTVFGVEIFINDHMDKLAEDATVGLYNNTGPMFDTALIGQKEVVVVDPDFFEEKSVVKIYDDFNSEENTIDYISGSTLYMTNNLAHTYNIADSPRVDMNSSFKWIQNSVVGVFSWCDTMLAANGIGEVTKYVDLRNGGNAEGQSSGELRIKNTASFHQYINDNAITLNNAACHIYEFISNTPTQVYIGVCEEPTWDSLIYRIAIRGYYNKRISSLAYYTSEDICLPVSFGEFLTYWDTDGSVLANNFAKALRTEKVEAYFDTADVPDLAPDPASSKIFRWLSNGPIVGLQHNIRVANSMNAAMSPIANYVNHKYLYIMEGPNEGQYRYIEDCYWASDSGYISITIDNYFENPLTVDTWVRIVDIKRTYSLDNWTCKGFIDQAGVPITSTFPSLYVWDEVFRKIPDFAYTAAVTMNSMSILAKFFDGNPDSLFSYIILPCSNAILTPEVATAWEIPGWNRWRDGLYYTQIILGITENHIPDAADLALITDKNTNTYCNTSISLQTGATHQPCWVGLSFEFNLPSLPAADFTFDTAYFISRGFLSAPYTSDGIGVCPTQAHHDLHFYVKRFTGGYRTITLQQTKDETTNHMNSYVHNLLDEYCVPEATTNNQYFYTDIPVAGAARNRTLYSKFEIPDCDSRELYESLVKGMLLWKVEVASSYRGMGMGWINSTTIPPTVECPLIVNLHELAVLFEASYDIADEIFTLFQSRVYNSTWDIAGTRRVTTDLIDNPIDMLEHICRLQNWSDRGSEPASGWGKDYAGGAMINTTLFDHSDLDTIRAYNINRQITDESEMTTDELKQSLCRDYNLISYTDKDGYECVVPLLTDTIATDNITLADIVDRMRISVVEPKPSDIYVEPFVNYAYDSGSGNYQKQISITNASAPLYNASYVTGLEAVDMQPYWEKCHALWQRSGSVEVPPSELTDLMWCNGEHDDETAQMRFKNWIDSMNLKIIKINLHYNEAKDWELGHLFNLTLPHQTDGAQWKCRLCKKTMTFYEPYVMELEALMLSGPA